MLKKLLLVLLMVALIGAIGLGTASASAGYSGYLKYVNTTYYYLLCTDYATGYPVQARNLVTTHTPNTYNSQWIVRCLCHDEDITAPIWNKLGDYTYDYQDYEHNLTGEKLVARPNSEVTGVTVGGTFWGSK